MPEPPSSVNSRESKHRLANIKLTEKEQAYLLIKCQMNRLALMGNFV
jgi:hypothetical protein